MVTPAQSSDSAKLPSSVAREGTNAKAGGYGLRRGVLSPMETLAQSISTVAPTLTPVATIPLVAALAGNGTWLAYIFSDGRDSFRGLVRRPLRALLFLARLPLLLRDDDPAAVALATAGWSLFLAYVATGASNIGGFY
jgi:hypothetical protein